MTEKRIPSERLAEYGALVTRHTELKATMRQMDEAYKAGRISCSEVVNSMQPLLQEAWSITGRIRRMDESLELRS